MAVVKDDKPIGVPYVQRMPSDEEISRQAFELEAKGCVVSEEVYLGSVRNGFLRVDSGGTPKAFPETLNFTTPAETSWSVAPTEIYEAAELELEVTTTVLKAENRMIVGHWQWTPWTMTWAQTTTAQWRGWASRARARRIKAGEKIPLRYPTGPNDPRWQEGPLW